MIANVAVPERVGLAEPLRDADRLRQAELLGDEREAARDDQHHEQQRHAAEDVDVGDRQPADRREAAARQLAQQGEHETPRQGQDPADERQLERLPEALQDEAELVPHDPEVEVLLEDDFHLLLLWWLPRAA